MGNENFEIEGLVHFEDEITDVLVHRGKIVSIRKKVPGYTSAGSQIRETIEYFHGAEKPRDIKIRRDRIGWSRSEIPMFPVVGPIENPMIAVGDMTFPQDQDGIARLLNFEPGNRNLRSNGAEYVQRYSGGIITNPRSGYGHPECLQWLPYMLIKWVEVNWGEVRVTFYLRNGSDVPMPFMFGWCPAFRTLGRKSGIFIVENEDKGYSLEDVVDASQQGVLEIANANKIRYVDRETGHGIEVHTRNVDFSHFLLWSPSLDAEMFCIEPVTHLPSSAGDYFSDMNCCKLEPQNGRSFEVYINPF